MKRTFIFLSALFVLSAFGVLTTTWKADPAHSQLAFTVKHFGISKITGYMHDFDVRIQSSKADFSDAVVTMEAKTASLNTRVEARDNHLRSADFFDAEKYPQITFKSTSVTADGNGGYTLTGNLSLHGVTKPVTLKMEHKGTFENPNNKKATAALVIKGTIKRSDFNLGSKFPEQVISDEVQIRGDGEFVQDTSQ